MESEQRVIAEIGENLAEVRVGLSVVGDGLEPAELTQLFQCEPVSMFKKEGRGLWITDVVGQEPDELFMSLLDRIRAESIDWAMLLAKYRVKLHLSLHVTRYGQGFSLSCACIARLGQLANAGVALDVNVYPEDDDDFTNPA